MDDEIITCPECGNCYKKINENFHKYNQCLVNEKVTDADTEIAKKLVEEDLKGKINNNKNNNNNNNNNNNSNDNNNNLDELERELPSETNFFLLKNNPSNIVLNLNKNPKESLTSLIVPEESINIFHNYINELEKSYNSSVDSKLVQYLPEITLTSNIFLGEIKKCTICCNEMKMNDKIIVLPCLDIFHNECIKKNFEYHDKCPNCGFELKYENLKRSVLNENRRLEES
jgi:hypothetical protein